MASTIKHFNHLRIPLEDVQEATNSFNEKNVIGQGDLGKVYKGKILRSGKWVKIAARRLDSKHKQGIEFLTEISALSSLKHENIVSFIGFCDEKGEKVIINKRVAKGSLVMYLSNPTLTWTQRLTICVGVARALRYIHNEDGHSYSVIHRNINSSTILLDNKFEAKLSGFEYSINHSVHRMDQVLFSEAIGTTGYMDPAIEKTGGVTHKSDIYSFGIVLWEIIYGRKAFIPDQFDRFLAPLAIFHYENKTVNDIIQPGLLNETDLESLDSFSKVAYQCLKERVQRPDMNYIVHELEKLLERQLQYLQQIRLLKIPLEDIIEATNNFDYRNFINFYDFGYIYEGKLLRSGKWVKIAARRSNNKNVKAYIKFRREIYVLSCLEHQNVVSNIGFCDEKNERIIINYHYRNGSLLGHLSKPTLTWIQRLRICVGVAHALRYIHDDDGRGYSIVHQHINCNSILLDKNFEAKLSGFEYSFTNSVHQIDQVLDLESIVSVGYEDPAKNYGEGGTHKSDIYSFGVVLWEILCGRRAYLPKEDHSFLAPLARFHYKNKTLNDIILPDLRNQIAPESLKWFSIVAYSCTEKNRNDRPDMNYIIHILGIALGCQILSYDDLDDQVQRQDIVRAIDSLEMNLTNEKSVDQVQRQDIDRVVDSLEMNLTNEKSEQSNNAVESISWNNEKVNFLDNARGAIPLSDILLITQDFQKYVTVSGIYDYYTSYLTEIRYVDHSNFANEEDANNSELPILTSTVCIKRFRHREDKYGEEVFFTELQMLITCEHDNIVSLFGFCYEGLERIIIIEHLSNGYLDKYLIDIKYRRILTWEARLKICIDIAHGLNYLHYEMEDQKMIINRNIRSSTIALDENGRAKIVDLGHSVLLPLNQDDGPLDLNFFGTRYYCDPEYGKTNKLKRASDVYSFGVVLFEIFCGRVASDPNYTKENEDGLAYVARRCFREGTLKEMVDPIIMEESGGKIFSLKRGPNKEALNAFLDIACECLKETQDGRPTMTTVVKELEKALFHQENNKDVLRISLEDIQVATENFHDKHCVGGGGFGKVYKGTLPQRDDTIVAKRLDIRGGQGEKQFRNELQILFEYKHENIIRFIGYCDEKDAKVIVCEYASRGSLDRYLNDTRLTWIKRLNICIDVATALEFLHGGVGTQATVIHRDIKTANILLNDGWNAKLADFGLSLMSAINQETDYVIDCACGTEGYVDPLYLKSRFLTKESDIYSFGVVLFEILCGRSTFEIYKREGVYLPSFIKRSFEEGKHDHVVFEEIKGQIIPKTLYAFQTVAYRCLHDDREERPKAKEVVEQLKQALELQMSRGDGASTSTSCQLQD